MTAINPVRSACLFPVYFNCLLFTLIEGVEVHRGAEGDQGYGVRRSLRRGGAEVHRC